MARFPALVLVGCVVASAVWAQEQPAYKQGDNPYQDEAVLTVGQPIKLYVEVQGTRFAELTLTPQGEVEAGKNVKCQVLLTGSRPVSGKAEVVPILLLEDGNGKSLERITLPRFKVRGERPFEYRETVSVSGDSLSAAAKVWIYLEVI